MPALPILPGTTPLEATGDLAAAMVAGISRYLDRALDEADAAAASASLPVSPADHAQSVATKRRELARIIGAASPRVPEPVLELVATTATSAIVAAAPAYDVYAVRWPALPPVGGAGGAEGLDGEGLLLEPRQPALATIIALPDADGSPEQFAGLAPAAPDSAAAAPFAARLAAAGCRVLVPQLIDRTDEWSGNPYLNKMTNQPHREFVYRMAFQLGRHVIGYEVQQVLSFVDWCTAIAANAPLSLPGGGDVARKHPIALFGYGEGALIALFAAALDDRIAATAVSGHFRNRCHLWREPIYRNVWRLLRGASDAELAAMIAPRPLIVEASAGPIVDGPPPERPGRAGAAPGRLTSIPIEEVRTEVARARGTYAALGAAGRLTLIEPDDARPGSDAAVAALLNALGLNVNATSTASAPPAPVQPVVNVDVSARLRRRFDQMCRYTQAVMRDSGRHREALWQEADISSLDAWQASCRRYRDQFWDDVIGRLPAPGLPPQPRSRLAYDRSGQPDAPGWTGYEVTIDLWPDVFAYGLLLLPDDLKEGERRPVVVCQHGLEGRPQDLIEKEGRPYHQFAARLVERGYLVYAPQNPYIGRDDFRWLQRKANPLGWSLFSFVVAQHRRTLDWLASLPFVDPARIAFYGLSYGGKTAMRVPALLEDYCLSICSGDFNEWIVKCASTDLRMSYMFTGEWEMFEFDLGHSFNYAEMAYLMAPRPFMVERGHRDGVAFDEWVAFEYAKVRRRYADLNIPERTDIAYFDGPHEIDGRATFPFLDRHLGWTPRTTRVR